MRAFSADWLALREPYDRVARAGHPLQLLAVWSRARARLNVTDLGSGTGSSLRTIGPALSSGQAWTLVEMDEALIERGQELIVESAVEFPWRYVQCDLASELEEVVTEETDLVTASALIDLVSEAWLDRLLAVVRRGRCALYLTLNYDGRIEWEPVDGFDGEAHALFEAHQRGDKGFGSALGAAATATLAKRLYGREGRLQQGVSDWLFGPSDTDIQDAMLQGMVEAGREIDGKAAASLDAWAARRRGHLAAGRSHCRVSHRDLLYLPISRIA